MDIKCYYVSWSPCIPELQGVLVQTMHWSQKVIIENTISNFVFHSLKSLEACLDKQSHSVYAMETMYNSPPTGRPVSSKMYSIFLPLTIPMKICCSKLFPLLIQLNKGIHEYRQTEQGEHFLEAQELIIKKKLNI